MKYLLDVDTCIYLINERPPVALASTLGVLLCTADKAVPKAYLERAMTLKQFVQAEE